MTNNPKLFLSRTGYREVSAGDAAVLDPGATINGVLFTGAAPITVTAAADTLTGTTLASNVLASSLTSVGTLLNLTVTNPISGSITGNAATVTTNANLTGPITSVGNATTIANSVITGAMLSGTGAARDFGITITGGTSVVATGAATASITVPFTGTITKWYLSADQSGSVVIDVKRSGTSIIGTGNKPTLSSAQTNNAAVSGWTSTAVTAGDVFTFNVNSVATLTSTTLVVSLNIT